MATTVAAPQNRTNVRVPMSVRALGASLRALDKASPTVAAVVAERVWMTPRRFRRPVREDPARKQARYIPIPWDLGTLRGYGWGPSGAPVVLAVHGWEGRGTQFASFVDPLVGAGFRVVAFDAPGHGGSTGGPTPLPRFADAIAAAVRAVGPVHGVVAHSFGAAATAYALGGGLAVDRAVFVAPMNPSAGVRRFCRWVGLSEEVRLEMERRLEDRYGMPLERFEASLLAARNHLPLLVVHDDADRIVPHRDGQAWASAWPGAELMTTSGLGHARILRDRDVVARATAFLDVRSAGPAPRATP